MDETTPLEQLSTWLQEGSYDDGIRLYRQLFGEGFLLSLFQSGPDDYNRQKLRTELEAHYSRLLAEAEREAAQMPDSLKSEIAASGALMDERTALKERMRNRYVTGDSGSDELKAMAYRILDIRDELDTVYGRRKFFREHGFMPDGPAAVQTEALPALPADLVKKRNSVRTYVSRYKKQLEEASSDADRERIRALLHRYQNDLANLDTLISNALSD